MTDTETPAAIIRRAARLMRECANAATPGPWEYSISPYDGTVDVSNIDQSLSVAMTGTDEGPAAINDAAHIASWDPAVALAVAGWLDGWTEFEPDHYEHGTAPDDWVHALNVARTYLKETND